MVERGRPSDIVPVTTSSRSRMKTLVACAVLVLGIAVVNSPADAKGCLKGAVVGGIAGHYAGHHGVLGAAAGCAIGRHQANKHAREDAQRQRSTTGSNPRY